MGILVIVKSTLCTYLFHLFIFLLQFLAVIFSTLIAYNREPVHPEEMDGTNPSWPIHIIVILILFSTLDLFFNSYKLFILLLLLIFKIILKLYIF